MFLVVLFLIKTASTFKKEDTGVTQQEGLTYNNEVLGNLVNKDTDGDGIPDWEEGLWGTDPTKKETTPGIPDTVAIEKLKSQSQVADNGQTSVTDGSPENLTQTDQFSRDLFATIAAATQDGQPLDQATIDKISNSLADHIQNSAPRKVFTTSDIKVIKDDSIQAIKKYSDTLNSINNKYPAGTKVLDVLKKFTVDQNNVDASVLPELDPIIDNTNKTIADLLNVSTPQSLSLLHLDLINALQRLAENISDIRLYDTDAIVALSGMSQYDKNTTLLHSAFNALISTIQQKLNN